VTQLHFVGPWDLDARLPVLPEPGTAPVVLIESRAKSSALPYHKQKLVLVLSAMRHFAEELRAAGHDVERVNARSYVDGLREVAARRGARSIAVMEPREWGMSQAFRKAEAEGALPPLVRHDDGGPGSHFVFTRAEALGWAAGRKELRMDLFYAFARKKSGLLMDAKGKPLGGKFSFDAENREPPGDERPPAHRGREPDAITRQAMEDVRRWGHGWGELDGFDWPVTRAAALDELERFFAERAALFGRYQDAMIEGEPYLWHTRIGAAMNLGLLRPLEVCQRIVAAHQAGMPLAAAEGLLRQILGWREYVRAMYWLRMPAMRSANALGAKRPLPVFYWEPERTEMRCVRSAAAQVHATGYAHHIQRLMVLGNFALLAGIDPLAVSHWFWAGFVDAYEWVELPNVHGMALFADDGFTTKPYAASGAYIHRMSDHCGGCRFDPKRRTGPDACPFNPLFWSFLARHRERFGRHPRLGALYGTWDRFAETERAAVLASADAVLAGLPPAETYRFDDDRC
jgi:deoxyribodipyrimidine photolyase-related protein